MKCVDYLPGAFDFDEAFDWYAERSTQAAVRFAEAVEDATVRVASSPEQFAPIDALHRGCLLKRFPFRIVYRIEPARIIVVVIAHAKRRPGFSSGIARINENPCFMRFLPQCRLARQNAAVIITGVQFDREAASLDEALGQPFKT